MASQAVPKPELRLPCVCPCWESVSSQAPAGRQALHRERRPGLLPGSRGPLDPGPQSDEAKARAAAFSHLQTRYWIYSLQQKLVRLLVFYVFLACIK